ncbi:phosphorelay sensor kinase [Venturia nashicola]|uniref:histidine kinase n=1 Tax=Venturia nashicola TaxID=86259 RepID=A0A4Z1NWS8_9PEZI|nr:phosphorelay sensor kinase [Venturia nashicola]
MEAPLSSREEHTSEPSESGPSTTKETYAQPLESEEECDWIEVLPDTEHIRFFRSVDWARTRLGPLRSWNHTLRQSTFQVLADSRPACLYWGVDYVAVYNAAFVAHAGKKHPAFMGSGFGDDAGFPELFPFIEPMFEQAKSTGIAQDVIETPMTTERNGYLEETFFTGCFTPIRNGYGQIEGLYNALVEVTKQLISERRTAMLNAISTGPQSTIRDVSQHVMKCLEMNELDVTVAMMYTIEDEREQSKSVLRLGGNHLGIPTGHHLLVDNQPLHSNEGLIPLCLRARSASSPLILKADERLHGIQWRGPKGSSQTIAVLPLVHGTRLYGFLILGTNPRLEDRVNAQLTNELSRMVSSLMASAASTQESMRRQEGLERDLAQSDLKIQHLVQHASVGMVHILLDGSTVWANEQYFSIIGLTTRDASKDFAFFSQIIEEDVHIAEREWQKLLEGRENIQEELRMKRMYQPPVGDPVPATILIFGFPYKEDGQITSLMACMTDVSKLKWAENWQARLAQEAQEAKRQQESFIDVVSHEIRNPLSAIIHCVDSIVDACKDHQSQSQADNALVEIVDFAKIIETCVNHQKYIIDSILTIGRLQSNMLSLTPSKARPRTLCQAAMDMFRAQFKSDKISTSVIAHSSTASHNVQEVYVDVSRTTQIFINLINNALKFVKERPLREIKIRYGACTSSPREAFAKDVHWPARSEGDEDIAKDEDWGTGERMYLTFSVNDSGIGIGGDEISNIFGRFRQANVKTHSVYGGSGLGLFICKQLAEKHGGEIGVRSAPGVGSSFVFYILVRRAPVGRVLPSRASSSQDAITVPTSGAAIRVLLVEDNLVNQQLLRKQLMRAGCIVHVANHGAEALEMLETLSKEIDVILMDTQMPVMDGLECTRRIRQLEEKGGATKRTPIIAVTANARKEQVEEASENGADAVMQKPFKTSNLIEAIKHNIMKCAKVYEDQSSEPRTHETDTVSKREPGLGEEESAEGDVTNSARVITEPSLEPQ